jgi:hypothetical protein
MSAALIVAVSWPEFTKVVVRSEPFQRTTDPLTKFDPLTVSVKPLPAAVAELGEIDEIEGTGLLAAVIVKFTLLTS